MTLKKLARLKSQHSGNVQASGAQRGSATEPASIEAFAPKPSDDERTLSIFANGAYYSAGVRLREIGVALLSVHQARGGVDVPSPEKHR
ncbi:hypothetical protein HU724_020125 [Pseudomonas iranensis]|uniref:hypothetical protein n=1 Tax=Pseudomonas iranensis TaxID=2745503 RepID=UPI001648198B|nr:hypothetical protein [Pseudomonas iranensis]QXI21315.1 hypothetical protein HU724_020125 [Pseudomonas iranensis]